VNAAKLELISIGNRDNVDMGQHLAFFLFLAVFLPLFFTSWIFVDEEFRGWILSELDFGLTGLTSGLMRWIVGLMELTSELTGLTKFPYFG
jgi:hypothetical protein